MMINSDTWYKRGYTWRLAALIFISRHSTAKKVPPCWINYIWYWTAFAAAVFLLLRRTGCLLIRDARTYTYTPLYDGYTKWTWGLKWIAMWCIYSTQKNRWFSLANQDSVVYSPVQRKIRIWITSRRHTVEVDRNTRQARRLLLILFAQQHACYVKTEKKSNGNQIHTNNERCVASLSQTCAVRYSRAENMNLWRRNSCSSLWGRSVRQQNNVSRRWWWLEDYRPIRWRTSTRTNVP